MTVDPDIQAMIDANDSLAADTRKEYARLFAESETAADARALAAEKAAQARHDAALKANEDLEQQRVNAFTKLLPNTSQAVQEAQQLRADAGVMVAMLLPLGLAEDEMLTRVLRGLRVVASAISKVPVADPFEPTSSG